MAERHEVYRGNASAPPQDIRDALGWLEPSGEEAIPHLIGAVMTLCLRVSELETEITALRRQVPDQR